MTGVTPGAAIGGDAVHELAAGIANDPVTLAPTPNRRRRLGAAVEKKSASAREESFEKLDLPIKEDPTPHLLHDPREVVAEIIADDLHVECHFPFSPDRLKAEPRQRDLRDTHTHAIETG